MPIFEFTRLKRQSPLLVELIFEKFFIWRVLPPFGVIKVYYDHLISNHKPPKAALARSKLLTFIHAILKNDIS